MVLVVFTEDAGGSVVWYKEQNWRLNVASVISSTITLTCGIFVLDQTGTVHLLHFDESLWPTSESQRVTTEVVCSVPDSRWITTNNDSVIVGGDNVTSTDLTLINVKNFKNVKVIKTMVIEAKASFDLLNELLCCKTVLKQFTTEHPKARGFLTDCLLTSEGTYYVCDSIVDGNEIADTKFIIFNSGCITRIKQLKLENARGISLVIEDRHVRLVYSQNEQVFSCRVSLSTGARDIKKMTDKVVKAVTYSNK